VLPTSQRSDVDDVIDRVAADATSAELSPDFHARVMARIEARRPAYAVWTLAAAVGGAVVLAIVIAHPWQRHSAPSQTTVAVTSPAIERVAASASTPLVESPLAEPRSRVVAHAPIFAPQVSALPAIEPIEPITRESIQPTRLSIPQLTVEPIVMPAVDDDGSIRERR